VPTGPAVRVGGAEGRRRRKLFVPWVIGVLVAGGVIGSAAGITLAVIFGAYRLPTASMWPSFAYGDRVFANKLTKEPERGAVMVFLFPERRTQLFVKRVMGMPGDELTFTHGQPTINGWKVPRCNVGPGWFQDVGEGGTRHEGMVAVEFLGPATYLVFDDSSAPTSDAQGPYHVNAGEYFVVGDNRGNSHDSRMWSGGMGAGVPLGDTVGRVRASHDAPVLRKDMEGLAGLGPALEACLAKRPSETTPPPPRAPEK
jgi:signal peptidase I